MARTRAFRRFKFALKKKAAVQYFGGPYASHYNGGWSYPSPKELGFRARTPKRCSCECCGNPRRFESHWASTLTLQERKARRINEEY